MRNLLKWAALAGVARYAFLRYKGAKAAKA